MSHGGSYSTGGDRLAKFAAQGRLKAFVSNELAARTVEPIKFRTPRGSLAYGYEATVLADLCEAILAARRAGVLLSASRSAAAAAPLGPIIHAALRSSSSVYTPIIGSRFIRSPSVYHTRDPAASQHELMPPMQPAGQGIIIIA